MRSPWQDQHQVPQTANPPATAEMSGSYDVIVVGAGITGLSTAVLLTAPADACWCSRSAPTG